MMSHKFSLILFCPVWRRIEWKLSNGQFILKEMEEGDSNNKKFKPRLSFLFTYLKFFSYNLENS